MARPIKYRKIDYIPATPYFIPSETISEEASTNVLKLEELEAIRLKDLEGLEQSECAVRMHVSRPTFQRILLSAREKIADSLINGKVIGIAGGNFTRNICPIRCKSCGKEWKDSIERIEGIKTEDYLCPKCESPNLECQESCNGSVCKKKCWKK